MFFYLQENLSKEVSYGKIALEILNVKPQTKANPTCSMKKHTTATLQLADFAFQYLYKEERSVHAYVTKGYTLLARPPCAKWYFRIADSDGTHCLKGGILACSCFYTLPKA